MLNCAKKVEKEAGSGVDRAEENPEVKPPPPDSDYEPTSDGPGQGPGDEFQYGGTATFVPDNMLTFSEYTGRPMNAPKNIVININMVKYGESYGGHFTLAYDENGYDYEGYFTTGGTEKATKYNKWHDWTTDGTPDQFHAVFEDFMGGLVLVIDQFVDLGDGQGVEDEVGGSVWFKNFGQTPAPHPPTYCWFVSLGPYDCRPWPSGRSMNTNMSLNPTSKSGYRRLGRFTGLSLEAAFNGELSDEESNEESDEQSDEESNE